MCICVYIPECNNNNEKSETCGNRCLESCGTRVSGRQCAEDCIAGCFCESGYARNAEGNCVPVSQCPGKCKR